MLPYKVVLIEMSIFLLVNATRCNRSKRLQKKPSESFVGIKHTSKYIHDEHAAGTFEKQRDANNDTAEGTHAREDSIKAMEVEAGPQTSLKMYLS